MTIHASTRDLTASQRMADSQPTPELLFICGHKGTRTGAYLRNGQMMKCAKCNVIRLAKKAEKQAQKVAA